MHNEQPSAVSDDERTTLYVLADDVPDCEIIPPLRSRRAPDVRTALKEIIVTAEPVGSTSCYTGRGGDHTRLAVVKNRSGQNRYKTRGDGTLMRELATTFARSQHRPVLNRLGIRSARGQTWTQLRVRNFRGAHQIPVYRKGERAERQLILSEAVSRLGVSNMTVIRLIRGAVTGKAGLHRRPLCQRHQHSVSFVGSSTPACLLNCLFCLRPSG
ncbi:hypothetical protein [Mesorhizobium sp. M2A.F.Ca.ET.067.02.1.1]|uniref:hypothetical protein n=1 Tax=Mesorhizobium sp. M2A.F.Ca.ET.067.02.1.1 TaxID=2496749 RepID=UPI000FD2AAD7|nr:hypothetical protein [Mesorhizobium sp. M2A.F.Ca.ET.067.02.1.1]RUW69188.1 hypothetical protein EOA28_25920 [Mesorhizobium sp. M2A.F.Ca.ET.067.02.1.1]TIU55183.1 MAG: hypothetical protein E5W35_19270 [Mesorhizobium sp.]